MRKIVELDTQTEKYPALIVASGPTKDTVTVKIGRASVDVDVVELIDALVIFEPSNNE
jgi:hypothetical protein